MDTTENAVLSISKDVLRQVMKDGKTYKELAQRMATILYHGMKDDGFPDDVEIIQYGSIENFSNADIKRDAKLFEERTGIPIYAKGDGRDLDIIDPSNPCNSKRVWISRLVRWQFGE